MKIYNTIIIRIIIINIKYDLFNIYCIIICNFQYKSISAYVNIMCNILKYNSFVFDMYTIQKTKKYV